MATIPMVFSGVLGAFPAEHTLKGVGVLSKKLSFADALTAKGSAIAQGDIFRILKLPEHCLILGWRAFVEEVPASGALDGTIDIGYSGAADVIIDGHTIFNSGQMALGTNGVLFPTGGLTFDTVTDKGIDVKLTTLSGTLASGIVRVDVVIADMGGRSSDSFAVRGAGSDPKS